VADDSNSRSDAAIDVLPPPETAFIAAAMRRVVTEGTARNVMAGVAIPVAGKTGTAQLDQGEPHAWFTGFAPYGAQRQIAFAVLVEHGGYGGRVAAPIARKVVEAACTLGLICEVSQ
jgi:cell division protein FtsI/penicillin-binding protein 2